MKTKMILATLLLALIAVALAACATTPTAAPTPTKTPQPPGQILPPVSTQAPEVTQAVIPTVAPPQATPEPGDDWASIQSGGKLIVGSSLDNPPYDQYDENFRPAGFDIALMTELAQRLGLTVEFNDFAFEGLLGALQLRQVDAAIAAISITPDRSGIVDFTAPYWLGSDAIIAGPQSAIAAIAGPQDLDGKKIGVQSGSVYETYLTRNRVETGLMPRQDLFVYARLDDAVRDLQENRVDLIRPGASGILNLVVAGVLESRLEPVSRLSQSCTRPAKASISDTFRIPAFGFSILRIVDNRSTITSHAWRVT